MVYRTPLALLLVASLTGGCASMQAAFKSDPLYTKMTDRDVQIANQTLDLALQTKKRGEVVTWANADSGHRGSITPTKTYRRDDGRYCRDYLESVAIATENEQWRDTACRTNDGRWLPLR